MKRIALAIGAGVLATGAVVASAASLGAFSVKQVGTNTAVVATCASSANDVKVKWNNNDGTEAAPAYDNTAGHQTYKTRYVYVVTPTACAGQVIRMAVAGTDVGGSGVNSVEANSTVADATTYGKATLDFTALGAFDSKAANQVTITIYDETAFS